MPRPTPAQAAPARPRTWLEMRERIEKILERRTGEGIAVWAARVAELGDIDEPQLRTWLTSEGVTGYPQMVLVMERFGYPDFFLASADELIDGQYADRQQLRPILDELLVRAIEVGEVDVQARKTYVTLVSPKRTFAIIRATTRTASMSGSGSPVWSPEDVCSQLLGSSTTMSTSGSLCVHPTTSTTPWSTGCARRIRPTCRPVRSPA